MMFPTPMPLMSSVGKGHSSFRVGAEKSLTGTSIDFTAEITPDARRITILFDSLSTDGTSIPIVQLGVSGGLETTGYTGTTTNSTTTVSSTAWNTGALLSSAHAATHSIEGVMILTRMSGNKWILVGEGGGDDVARTHKMAGFKSLAGVLTQIRLTMVNGTDSFDAGNANVLVEN